MSVRKEKDAASRLVLGALFLIQGGIAASGAFAVCLRSNLRISAGALNIGGPELFAR